MNNRADRNLIKRRRPPTRQPALHRLHDPFPQIQRIRLPHSYWPPCSSQHLESHFNSRGNPNSDSARPDYALIVSLLSFVPRVATIAGAEPLTITRALPLRIKRRGVEMRLVIGDAHAPAVKADPILLKEVARAYRCFDAVLTGKLSSMPSWQRTRRSPSATSDDSSRWPSWPGDHRGDRQGAAP